jgi:hypothetical protein
MRTALFTLALVAGTGIWTDDAATQAPNILWSADHEKGNLSEWYENSGGGEFNSGNAISTASADVVRTGRFSAKATIFAPPVAGVRLFRWSEIRSNPEAYYSAWYYFPRIYRAEWWNIFQFKSRSDNVRSSDPFWFVQVGNRRSGAMYLYLTWWGQLWQDRGVEGPHRGEFEGHNYGQVIKDLPVGQWVHIEAFLRQSSAFDGQIIVWQDGVEILKQDNVRTRYPAVAAEWSLNNYAGAIWPTPATIYIDDASISTTRVGGDNGGFPPRPALSAP